jgi:hypothetical protein
MEGSFTGALARQFGTYYPTGYVVAVLEPEAVAGTVDALRAGPCAPDEVRAFSGQEVLDIAAAVGADQTPLQRLGASLASDEGEAQTEYREEARQGRSLLVVHAPDDAQTERVRQVLAAHGARRMRHYGRFVMTDLRDGPPAPPAGGAAGAADA